MNKPAPNPYLRTKIMTASPEELRLLLYDGCLKFCRQGRTALAAEKPDFEAIYENLMRAQKIVLELSTSLNHTAAPDLCEKLGALYTYIYRLLVDGNMQRDPSKIDEAIQLMEFERETWVMLMDKKRPQQDTGGPAAAAPMNPYAQQTALSSYSKSA